MAMRKDASTREEEDWSVDSLRRDLPEEQLQQLDSFLVMLSSSTSIFWVRRSSQTTGATAMRDFSGKRLEDVEAKLLPSIVEL